ncbi:MAG: hypothetical protein FWE04_01435 [Oscillospiraceae bacterium]|nr:hypothetical protein [Oscillospiraceae bacterium]
MFALIFARGSASGALASSFCLWVAAGRATVWECRRNLDFANGTPVKISKESKAIFADARFDEIYHSSSFSRAKTWQMAVDFASKILRPCTFRLPLAKNHASEVSNAGLSRAGP